MENCEEHSFKRGEGEMRGRSRKTRRASINARPDRSPLDFVPTLSAPTDDCLEGCLEDEGLFCDHDPSDAPSDALEHFASARRRLTDREISILEKHTLQCTDVRGIFGDYYDDDLPVSLKLRVTEHLANCPDCLRFAAEYHTVVETARSLRAAEPPAGVRTRLRAALNQRLGLSLPLDEGK